MTARSKPLPPGKRACSAGRPSFSIVHAERPGPARLLAPTKDSLDGPLLTADEMRCRGAVLAQKNSCKSRADPVESQLSFPKSGKSLNHGVPIGGEVPTVLIEKSGFAESRAASTQIQSARSHYALRYDGHSLSLPHDTSRALYRLKGAKSAFRPPHESSTLREPGTKGCRTYPAVVILPQAATTTPSPDLPSRPRELPTALAGAPQSLHSLPQEHS